MPSEIIPLCWFNRHAPDRNAVDWDGYEYVASCRHCGKGIRRRGRRHWERDWKAKSG